MNLSGISGGLLRPASHRPRSPSEKERAGRSFRLSVEVILELVLFPSMGYGWFGLRSGEAARLNRTTLLGRTAFGIGIGL